MASKISTPSLKYFNVSKSNSNYGYLRIINSKNLNYSKKYFKKMKYKKLIIKDKKDYYYIYKISNKKHSQIGILGTVDLKNYDDKNILGHEETFKNRVIERKKQMLNISTQIGPIYTTYKYNKKLNNFLRNLIKSKPIYSFKSLDKFIHQVWAVNQNKNLKNLIKKITKIYVCDGHHRLQGMIKYKKKISSMIVAFPHNQIQILDYNRVVKSQFSKLKILKIISRNFIIKKIKNKSNKLKKGLFNMYMDKQWYSLNYNKKNNDLDVKILHENILSKIKIKNIDYISGLKDSNFLKKMVNSDKFNMAFMLFPTDIKTVIKIADKKKFMPPKSTWFHPKPLDGLISFEI